MLRDFKLLHGNNRKSNDVEEIENIPINPNESNSTQVDQDVSGKSKFIRTPTKPKGKNSDNVALPLRTPERQLGAANVGKNRFRFSSLNEGCGEGRSEMANYLSQSTRYGSSLNLTPRVNGGVVRGGASTSTLSECTSTQSTPTKSVSKPPNPGFAPFSSSRPHGSARGGNYGALSRRFSVSNCPPCIVNTVEVPHFDLKEDPSFWMHHNVQVILRVRPLNSFEINTNGYNRCVKQDNPQCITWVGQPETRFRFDHVACETVDQEMLFRMAGRPMVENCLSGYNSCMFAYGQTGSGKTFTMLGETEDLEFKPSPHRGMTPRIFEFLFARIRAEEESRRDEKLKYSCKCSFLEIYNEQITDLLDPSSSNLLLREDVKKGVYVENLSEFEVHTVGDVVRLLVQGSSNRKVAATNMNRESSRSHSVFTCIIECKWERDSTTNLRFARLNLVDLAGSERQKSSGAEGERLKEAANINKSLSTLGHVIMLLVDIAHGKPRHVPYRDSRLTFLLQDSLGGNSKTMIIANISPSICCAAETLNTLKFAQRAKLIQNNAVVNEDSTGDVAVLQRQICLLQEELSALKRQSVSRTLAFDHPSSATCPENIDTENKPQSDEIEVDKLGETDSEGSLRVSYKQLKAVESMLAGALRREQMAETSIRQLEAEIEHLNRLVRQREEDTRCSKMMLKFREDKIQRMESVLGDLKPVDSYLAEENAALVEEVQMLQAKVDKNPEVTRFALENIRLLGQLRKFQDFYEEGERDILLNEVSELRAQLIHVLEHGNQQTNHQQSAPDECSNLEENQSLRSELMNTMNELDECRSKLKSCLDSNAKLNREIEELQAQIRNKEPEIYNHQDILQMKEVDAAQEENCKINQGNLESHTEEMVNMELELDILRIILKEERLSHKKTEEMANDKVIMISQQFEDARRDVEEAKAVIEALESQQLLSINEIEDLKNLNSHYQKVLRKKEHEISVLKEQTRGQEYAYSCLKRSECEDSALQTQLKRMQASLDKAKRVNMSFQCDRVSRRTNEEEMDEIRRQAEAETAEVIVSLQEELCMLQQQVHESELREKEMENKQKELMKEAIYMMSQDNEALHSKLLEKNAELKSSNNDWEQLSCEIEDILVEGCEALGSASDQLDSISSAFSNRKGWIFQQFGKLMRLVSEKESIIAELNQCLEDANSRTNDLEQMLISLRGATMAVTESHQQDCLEKEHEILVLRSELSRKAADIAELDDKIKLGQNQLSRISNCATAAFIVINRLSEINSCHLDTFRVLDTQLRQLQVREEEKYGFLEDQASALEEARAQIDRLGKELEISESNCTRLTCQLDEQQRHISDMQRKLEENDEKAIENTKAILNDLKMGVFGLKSSVNQYVEVGHPETHGFKSLGVDHFSVEKNGDQEKNEINNAASSSSEHYEDDVSSTARNTNIRGQNDLPMKNCCRNGVNNSTIILLRKELESAMESLKQVQEEMVHLRAEKEAICISEKKGREGIEILKALSLSVEVAFSDFEKQCESKISALSRKLLKAEEFAEEAKSSWWKTRESLEYELVNVEAAAAQKEVEASCLLARFEEVQDTIQEADIMINGLMIANENLKLEVEDLKRRNAILKVERDDVSNEVKDLESSNELKDTQCKNLEEQFESSISEMMSHVEDLEKLVQDTSEETFVYLAKDFKCVKSQLEDTVKLVHSSLEEIWSEIVVKDCALSVLHLCHNMKSKEELEMCRLLKGKVLADIKKSFDRISSKEKATEDVNMKLISFKEKLEALQYQEESMFERSNIIASELDLLMKELGQSNLTVMASLTEQEEVIESRAEDFMVQMFAKDLVLLILTSELQQLDLRYTDQETQQKTSLGYIDELKSHNCMLLEKIATLELKIASLQHDLETKTAQIDDIVCSRLYTDEELCNQSRESEGYVIKGSEMQKEILILRDQLHSLKQRDCVSSVEIAEQRSTGMLKHFNENIITVLDQISEDACMNLDLLSNFLKELEFLDSSAKDLVSENKTLQEELVRKDEVLNGLLFDLHLLQESAANSKDQKDVIDELRASLESAEHEIAIRSYEYDEISSYNDTLEAKLKEREGVISELEADLGKANQSVKILSDENDALRSHIENIMEEKSCVDKELSEKKVVVDRLENELLEMGNTLGQLNELAESLKSNLDEVSNERDYLQNELLISKEKVETAYALAEENEAIAAEAQEIAESRKIYAEEKEEEVELLESSVLELDSTISVLENKVELLNGEAERQRLQREELELELQNLKNQMHNIESSDADIKRHLDEKAINLREALKRIRVLETELTNKDAEIAQCKTHISELTVHAEAQACEYKNKFKELEAMVGELKAEEASNNDKISSSNKLEKNGSKGRGSASPFKVKGSGSPFKGRGTGSPFKCIGLGLTHQFKSEKDEDLTAERHRIEELEALAASRQKEIFMLNARLAAAESMTHDVIRDLLGVKLDMNNYVKLLDKQQVQKMIEKARFDSVEPQNEEVKHLKRHLNEFIEERRGWLEEIDRRQAELVAAQDALENHRQEQQTLIAENDVLKKRVIELEGEVKKLSGQQNLHQRIHHHAKIKEENNVLKTQNEDLSFRLQRAESYLSRVKEELSHYRARRGRDPCINFDLEQRLTNKLKEVEEEKVHLAHTLLGLCTSILKATGITRPASEINVSEAEEALEHLSDRIISLERELDELNLKHKITKERVRLAELMPPDSSPLSTRRAAQTPFFSALDR